MKVFQVLLFSLAFAGLTFLPPGRMVGEELEDDFKDVLGGKPEKWDWQNPTWFPYELTGIWGSDPHNIWAVGVGGTHFFHYDGNAWQSVPVNCQKCGDNDDYNNSCVFLKIHGTAANNIWAIGNHAIMHFDGTEWKQEFLKPTGECSPRYWFRDVISFEDGSTYIAGHYFNGKDNSRAMAFVKQQGKWFYNRVSGHENDSEYRSIFDHLWGSSANNVIAFGDQKLPGPHGYRREFLAKNISIKNNDVDFEDLASAPNFVKANLFGTSNQDIWAIGEKRLDLFDYRFSIQHFDGNSWKEVKLSLPNDDFSSGIKEKINAMQKIYGSSSQDIWAVGGSMFNTLYYDGLNWSEESQGIANYFLRSVWSASANFGFAVGAKAGPAGGRGVVIPLKANKMAP